MAAHNDAVQLTSAEEREAFSSAFPGVIPEGTTPLDNSGQPLHDKAVRDTRGMSEEHMKFLRRLDGAENRLRLMGVTSATVLNLNPYRLQVNSTLMGNIICPPCESGKPYSITVIRDVRWSSEEGNEGDRHPIPWVPIMLAREFSEQFYHNGGVVVYQGDGDREDPEVTMKKDPSLDRNYKAAKQQQIKFAEQKVREANGEWNSPNRTGARNINEIHRACAMLLHDVRGQELPQWIEKIPGQYGLGEQCPICKATPQSGAIVCPGCSYVLDPRDAFDRGLIDIADTALTRLDRKVLKEMGISELVEETISERNARLRKEAIAKKKEQK